MSFIDDFLARESNVGKFSNSVKLFIYLLSFGYMLATFQHAYWALRGYEDGMSIGSFDLSFASMLGLVFVMDLTIYFSLWYIPQAKIRGVSYGYIRVLFGFAIVISAVLNTFYMIRNIPNNIAVGWNWETIIAVMVGLFIPLGLALLGATSGKVAAHAEEVAMKQIEEQEKPKKKKRKRRSQVKKIAMQGEGEKK